MLLASKLLAGKLLTSKLPTGNIGFVPGIVPIEQVFERSGQHGRAKLQTKKTIYEGDQK